MMQYTKLLDNILEFRPNAVQEVRMKFGLDQPGRMDEAIEKVHDWIQKQDHFVRKDFNRDYLERLIITSQGRIEKVKLIIDKTCTYRTLLPEYFKVCDVREEFKIVNDVYDIILPKQTDEYYRIHLFKLGKNQKLTFDTVSAYFKRGAVFWQLIQRYDYSAGYISIFDLRDANLTELVTHMNPIEGKKTAAVFLDGFGLAVKGVHVLTESKIVDILMSTVKLLIKPKIFSRIHIHNNLETLYDLVQKDLLPEDYGGNQKPSKHLNDDWMKAVTSTEFVEYLRSLTDMKTDESKRSVDIFNNEYLGAPGTFRTLVVD